MNDLNLISLDDMQFMCETSEPAAQDMFSVNYDEVVLDDLDIDDLWAK